MERLIAALKIMHNPGAYQPEQVGEASSYCNDFVSQNFQHWASFYEYLSQTDNPQIIRFWMLTALTEMTNKILSKLPQPELEAFCKAYFDLLLLHPQSILSESFLLKKYAVLLVAIIENISNIIRPNIINL